MAISKGAQQTGLAAVVGVVASGIILNVLPTVEGKANDPYRDSVGVLTVCYGETNVAMKHYTDQECLAMLDTSAAKYAKAVVKCVPQIAPDKAKPYQLAASVIMDYNVGDRTFCTSQAASLFRSGKDAAACAAMANFNKGTFAKGVKPPKGTSQCVKLQDGRTRCVINGLNNRRRIEVGICQKGLGESSKPLNQ